jgi:small subunit ribosomal protein S19
MAKKETHWRGKAIDDLKQLDLKSFIQLVNSSARRKLNRGFTEAEKTLIDRITKGSKNIKTHCRDIIITPAFLDMTIKLYSGKEYIPLTIVPDMLGHRLGEFVQTRKGVQHSAPGVGATRSSAAISVK